MMMKREQFFPTVLHSIIQWRTTEIHKESGRFILRGINFIEILAIVDRTVNDTSVCYCCFFSQLASKSYIIYHTAPKLIENG
ncbi:hypothetical protein L6452_04716 [Arctium lappa]|uniref:Uncharacterized protein n=1 Tax=Arctium lappa TaxID=4217 RepID=A0ACB9EFG2_ARCLA|nr:hypothetical protein L6452_04716 [Arctium lappa]